MYANACGFPSVKCGVKCLKRTLHNATIGGKEVLSMNFDQRTVTCGQLRGADAGKTVVLNGWVHRDRNHGALHFINLRDRYGITQVVVDDDARRPLPSSGWSIALR